MHCYLALHTLYTLCTCTLLARYLDDGLVSSLSEKLDPF